MNPTPTPPAMKDNPAMRAAEQMDWIQVVLNGGPPCFHICEDGKFCGRAERWEGHGHKPEDLHKFTSLADLLSQFTTAN